jgi:hypothetical protein
LVLNRYVLVVIFHQLMIMTRDSDQEIGQRMYFKVADSDELRFYPYIEKIIGDIGSTSETNKTGDVTDNSTKKPS